MKLWNIQKHGHRLQQQTEYLGHDKSKLHLHEILQHLHSRQLHDFFTSQQHEMCDPQQLPQKQHIHDKQLNFLLLSHFET